MNLTKTNNFVFKTQENPVFTIIACNTSQARFDKLQEYLLSFNFKSKVLKSEPKALKWMVASYKPKFIVTDHNLWEKSDAFSIIKDLRQANNTPLVIWSASVSEKILTEVFKFRHVYHINQENDMVGFWNATARIAQ